MTRVCRLASRASALTALVVGLCLALLAPTAAAHALLIASQPGVDATVAQSPRQILITFSEPVDPTLSKVQVFDTQGRPQAGVASSQPVAGNQQQLRVPLKRPLPNGVYTIEWQTVSALDGHFAGGTYAFGIGVANVGTVAPFGKFVSTATWLTTLAAAGRWLLYAGLALLIGAAGTCGLVSGRPPAPRRNDAPGHRLASGRGGRVDRRADRAGHRARSLRYCRSSRRTKGCCCSAKARPCSSSAAPRPPPPPYCRVASPSRFSLWRPLPPCSRWSG